MDYILTIYTAKIFSRTSIDWITNVQCTTSRTFHISMNVQHSFRVVVQEHCLISRVRYFVIYDYYMRFVHVLYRPLSRCRYIHAIYPIIIKVHLDFTSCHFVSMCLTEYDLSSTDISVIHKRCWNE
eukprot:NODE_338_length_9271_cov_0.444178.p6 type:complete len:126 gc:universal NODE_338_length_9271_cov_0.444178:805-428(-)